MAAFRATMSPSKISMINFAWMAFVLGVAAISLMGNQI